MKEALLRMLGKPKDRLNPLPKEQLREQRSFKLSNIEEIDELPLAVMLFLQKETTMARLDKSRHRYDMIATISHPDKSHTYVVIEGGVADSRGITHRKGFAIDVVQQRVVGWTKFRYDAGVDKSTDPSFSHPWEWIANTRYWYQNEGLGQRRLMILNQEIQKKYGISLCSGIGSSNKAVGVWKKLVREGLADPPTDKQRRYCFKGI